MPTDDQSTTETNQAMSGNREDGFTQETSSEPEQEEQENKKPKKKNQKKKQRKKNLAQKKMRRTHPELKRKFKQNQIKLRVQLKLK